MVPQLQIFNFLDINRFELNQAKFLVFLGVLKLKLDLKFKITLIYSFLVKKRRFSTLKHVKIRSGFEVIFLKI